MGGKIKIAYLVPCLQNLKSVAIQKYIALTIGIFSDTFA